MKISNGCLPGSIKSHSFWTWVALTVVVLSIVGCGGGASTVTNDDPIVAECIWSGRALLADKQGSIPGTLPPILKRLDLRQKHWLGDMRHYGSWYYRAVGSVQALERYCQHLGQQWLKSARPTRMLTS